MNESEDIEKLRRDLAQAQALRRVLSDELARANQQLEERIQSLFGERRIVDALKHIGDVARAFETIGI